MLYYLNLCYLEVFLWAVKKVLGVSFGLFQKCRSSGEALVSEAPSAWGGGAGSAWYNPAVLSALYGHLTSDLQAATRYLIRRNY